jgi:hypothetical protein
MFYVVFSDHRLITAYFFLSTIDFWLNMLVVRKQNRQTITPDFTGLLTMKMKQFRSILAVAVVAASITASISPAQAFTWEELWGAVKTGVQKGFQDAAQSSAEKYNDSNNSDAPQAGGSNNETPETTITSQQNNDSESSPAPVFNCTLANGNGFYKTQGADDSIVSVGRSAMKTYERVEIYPNNPHGSTCAIEAHPADEKIGFAFAIPDNSNLDRVRVTIYVDGQPRINKIISRGRVGKYTVDSKGANSYAFTLETLSGNGTIYSVE